MMGNHDRAILDFEAAVAIDENYADALLSLGNSRLRGEIEEEFKIEISHLSLTEFKQVLSEKKLVAIEQAKSDF